MNAKSWMFSLFTGIVLIVAALVSAFFLMWGMMHFKTSVKPYAYALFGVLSFLIIIIAAAFAGPISSWAAKKLFPNYGGAEFTLCLIASLLAIIIGGAALFITMPMVLAIFNDPLPHQASMMRVRFPEKTRVVFSKSEGGAIWNEKLIVKLDADGWEEFHRNATFQTNELKITSTNGKETNFRDWRTFEIAENKAQNYRWINHAEPALLKVLALRADDGQVYVYLYLIRNYKGV